MRARITEKQLQYLVDRINKTLDRPMEPWKREKGRSIANIGNFHLSGAYGGVSLQEMVTDGGGVHDVFSCGHVTKRELEDKMRSFLDGLTYQQDKR